MRTNKVLSWDEVPGIVKMLRDENKTIVFTNGCFDVLHKGHIYNLREARTLGDVLILGLNSDSSIKMLKGPDRPINNEEDRVFVLSALEMVDYIVVFEEETPYNLVKLIVPDILAKGGDYKVEEIAGHDIAKKTVLIPLMDGYSSTKVIEILNK